MTSTASVTDRIEKRVVLRAPRSRVWRALTDATEFGTWFGVTLRSDFAEGATIRGQITHPNYQHVTMEVVVERMEPEHTSRIAGIPTRSTRTSTTPTSRQRSWSSGSRRPATTPCSPLSSRASTASRSRVVPKRGG